MKKVSQSEFEKIFPELNKVYEHSDKISKGKNKVKFWDSSVGYHYIVENWEYHVEQYWKYNK